MTALRLLLIDDDAVDRMAVKRLLRQTRFAVSVEERTDRDSAMEVLGPDRFDCVLLDYHIPGTDGLKILRDLRVKGETVPVIALTGQGDEELAVELMKAGASDYLNKNTLNADRLERSLRYALALHRAEEERRQLLVRERRAREDAQNANRAKDEFLATLSHELRTPLNAILGWSRLLSSGNLDHDTSRKAIEIIDRNTRLQAQLIEDLLDISRIITGKLRLEFSAVPPRGILEAAVDSVGPAAEARNVTVEQNLDGCDDPILCDPGRMQQVVWNLLSNAIKFTPEGGTVTVSCTRDESIMTILVSDTGIGIEPEFLPYVFERFRQQDGASTRAHGGLGLGLSIVRHLVELHGGSVEAHSDGPGRGSTFAVRVPIAPAPRTEAELGRSPHADDLPSLSGLTILVVDNDSDARGLLRTVLERSGGIVVEAASADEAIAAISRTTPDVLLSDIAMPGTDGYALIRRVRELNDFARAIPAAALTGHATASDRTRALLAGFQAHLPKPIDPAELAAVVAALAGRTVNRSQIS